MIIGCLGMMLMLSWQLTLFVLVLLPLAGWIMGAVGKNLKKFLACGAEPVGHSDEQYRGKLLAVCENAFKRNDRPREQTKRRHAEKPYLRKFFP